jgi:hypothetical protein
MNKRRPEVPEYKDYEYALGQAWAIACDKLANVPDIELQCRKSGSECRKDRDGYIVSVPYLNREYTVTLPGVTVSAADSAEEVPLREKVLILHYFLAARGIPLSGEYITFRELPEGKVYLPTFAKRTTAPLVKYFGTEPEKLAEAAEKMGARRAEYGDTAVTIDAFKFVPVTLVIWKGDDEFPPEANVLFDSTITGYLSTEDLIVLCEQIIWKLVRSA